MSDARHTVILKGDLPDLERELLRRYCHELHGSDGSTLLQFLCTEVETRHPLYLEMEAILPRRQGGRRIRVPHALVFLIETQSDAGTRTPPAETPAALADAAPDAGATGLIA